MRLPIGFFLAGALLAGCPSNNTPVDSGGVDSTMSDMGTTETGNTDGASCNDGFIPSTDDSGTCYRASTCDMMPFCPAVRMNSSTRGSWLITQLDITEPRALASTGAVGRLLNTNISAGAVFWGIDVDFTANTLRTGAMQQNVMPEIGVGFYNGVFNFISGGAPAPGAPDRWNPISSPISLTGETFSTTESRAITIPLFNNDAQRSLLAELPLSGATMHDVKMGFNRNCIGSAKQVFNSCVGGRWNTRATPSDINTAFAILEGNMSVSDAIGVNVESLGQSLCQVIAGSPCTGMPSTWTNPPMCTTPDQIATCSWHIRAEFSAVAVSIQ